MARLPFVIPYDPEFLGDGFRVSLPTHCCSGQLVNGGQVLDYIHFSLVMHQDRKSALFTAHNIDLTQKRRASRDNWELDLRINTDFQTGNEAYYSNPWDRGHLVRRDAVVWGPNQEEAQAASDSTFYFTNAALQHSSFNQSNSKWLGLENWVLDSAGDVSPKLCVFTGPIYTQVDEFTPRGFRIPSAFFKIVVLRDPTDPCHDLSAVGFVMKQNENWRNVGPRAIENLELYHESISEIEQYTGLSFGEITLLDEFDWRQPRFQNRDKMAPIKVDGPDDIQFFGPRKRAKNIRALKVRDTGQIRHESTETPCEPPPSDCGCGESGHGNVHQEIVSLKTQVTQIWEILEELFENSQDNFEMEAAERLRVIFSRIVGGKIVKASNFQDCVAIGNENKWFCSGVLVHPRIVLTAAHCVPANITRVFLKGRQISALSLGEVIDVAEVLMHPNYDARQIPYNDIAVLILAEDSTVDPIEIATQAEVDCSTKVTLAGFGSDSPNGQTGFGTKRQVSVPRTMVADLDLAQKFEHELKHGYDSDFEFQAGEEDSGIDSCRGDSGGPVYIKVGDKLKLAGLTSRASGLSDVVCGDGNVNTRITPYLGWIFEVTNGLIGLQSIDNESIVDTEGLYISAALPNPAGPDAGFEWIELRNSGTGSIHLEGLFLLKDRQGGQEALTGAISANSTRRFVLSANSPVKLGNNGDDIILEKDGNILHQVSYSSAGAGEVFRFDPPQTPPKDPDSDPNQGNGNLAPC